MTMDYIRVRKSNMKELQGMLEQRKATDWRIVAAIFGMVVAVAVTGIVLSL